MDKQMNQNVGKTGGNLDKQNQDFTKNIGKSGGSQGNVSGQGVGNQEEINR